MPKSSKQRLPRESKDEIGRRFAKSHGTIWLADTILRQLYGRKKPWVLALGGFTAVGKSTLAKRIGERAGVKTVVLSCERAMMERPKRDSEKIGDLSQRAFKMAQYEWYARDLLETRLGKSVDLPRYDREAGRYLGKIDTVTLEPDGLLVLDGPWTTQAALRLNPHISCFLFPSDRDRWEDFAVVRDVGRKSYPNKTKAWKANKRKFEDLRVIWRNSQRVTYTVIANIFAPEPRGNEDVIAYQVLDGADELAALNVGLLSPRCSPDSKGSGKSKK